MAGQGDIRAGRAFVEVFTDDSQLQQGLLAINKRMDAWSQQFSLMGMRAMAAAGAFSIPFAAGIKLFSDFGDQIEKMAYRTGMSTEFLSGLGESCPRNSGCQRRHNSCEWLKSACARRTKHNACFHGRANRLKCIHGFSLMANSPSGRSCR